MDLSGKEVDEKYHSKFERENKSVGWEATCGFATAPSPSLPQWGTVDAEIKNPPGGSHGLSKVPFFKPGVGI